MIYSSSISHPQIFSQYNGDTQLDTKLMSINRSISLILLTAKGELFGNPNFGSDIKQFMFINITDALFDSIKTEIVNSIMQWETRIYVDKNDIDIEQSDDQLKIHIGYTLVNSSITFSTDVFTQITPPLEV